MANTLILKKSSAPGKVPLATDLQPGEVAVNLADAKLYTKNTAGEVLDMSNHGPIVMCAKTVNIDTTIPSKFNAQSIGPLNISEGISVSLSDNSTWSIL